VFGYYLEISNAHAAKVPPDYERRQTLASAERYVTPELKRLRSQGARRRGPDRGARGGVVCGAPQSGRQRNARVQRTARALARLDVWSALAESAVQHRYVRPEVDDGFT